MKLSVYFDGSYATHFKRPGCGYGFLVKNEESEVIYSHAGRVGRGQEMSSNVGEYEGLYQSMLYIQDHYPTADVIFYGDSEMVIRQMNGQIRALHGAYMPYYIKAAALAAPFIADKLWTFIWIPREWNREADELSQIYRF